MKDDKIRYLLDLVIENYIDKWEPIWSKFLYSLDETEYAPSTLRKYLNFLEKEWLLYQPYNSAWRIPTIKWLSNYIDDIMEDDYEISDMTFDIKYARNWLRYLIETLWNSVDGTVVWFLKNDEYYFLWINNLLKSSISSGQDYETTKHIIRFVEDKKIIKFLSDKLIKKDELYYDFVENDDKTISVIYGKIEVSWYDGIISVIWPTRVDYKKNVSVLKNFFRLYNKKIK